ncbi:MAG: MFS transporter [Clostridiales Family XIII bacterium]|jgi:MFS family permease|nr:MFS transporter [Clostridiales Family XIII bacterium]
MADITNTTNTTTSKPITKLWNKNFILATACNLCYALVFLTLMTTLAAYSKETFGVTEGTAGLTVSIFILSATIFRIVGAKYLDIIGRRKVLFIGGALSFVIVLGYFIPGGIALLIVVRILNGMAFGLVCTALATVVVDFIPIHRRGEGLGYFTLSNILATAAGPLIGLFLLDHFGHIALFIFITAISFVPMILMPLMNVREQPLTAEERKENKISFRPKDLFEMKSLPIAFVTVIVTICYSALPAFMRLYTAELGIPEIAQVYFIVYAVVVFFSRPFSGWLLDRIGDNPVVYPTLLFFMAGVLLIAFAQGPVAVIIAAVLQAIGYGAFFSAFQVIAVNAAPAHRVGMGMATFYVFADAGMGLGPFIWGSVVHKAGYSHTFIAESAVVFGAFVLYHFLHGRTPAAKYKKQI